jgi:magnesium chelatase family protein
VRARKIQAERLRETRSKTNAEMNVKDIDKLIELSKEVKDVLGNTAKRLSLSARAYHRVVKLSRTIADLDESPQIDVKHILEALQYRPKQE